MTDSAVEPTPLINLRWPIADEPHPEDWTLLGAETEPFMMHDPTGTVFQIGYDPDRIVARAPITIFVLYALVFFVDERHPPTPPEIRRLGRESILTFWMLLTNPGANGMDLSTEVTLPADDVTKEVDDAH